MPTNGTRALFLSNPKSRSGSGEQITAAISRLKDSGIEPIQVESTSAEDACRAVARFGKAVDFIVVVGGDGTLHSVADALLKAGKPLGILPAGTANDLARSLDIPADIAVACELIIAGHTRRIDLGSINGEYFFNAVHIGLGVEITHQLTPEVKKSWGVFSYLKAFFGALTHRKSFRMRLLLDDRCIRMRTIQVSIGNGRFYGGGTVIHEDASIQDGRLWLYSLRPQSAWDLLTLAPWLRGGRHTRPDRVFAASAARIEIHTHAPKEVHADGEPVTRTPATLKIHPGVLEVFAPPETGTAV